MGFMDRLRHGWNAFASDYEPTLPFSESVSYGMRPDRTFFGVTTERSIVASIYNRISIDVASNTLRHVRVDENDRFVEEIDSFFNQCLKLTPNIDQTGRAFFQDLTMTLCQEGFLAVVPVDTTLNPKQTSSYDIRSMRVGSILEWYPKHVKVRVYNENSGRKEDLILRKDFVAIIENPLYAVMNEQNSTLKRLISKLTLLDKMDGELGAGKLDLIIQLPYVIKTDARRIEAEKRRKDIEKQLTGSQYGIAYTDGTEKITQLNRPAENNLLDQINTLTAQLYQQLGLTEDVFKGTAKEEEMLNYHARTIEPILAAITDSMKRSFLTKTARSQGQSIMYFQDPFKLVPASQLGEITSVMIQSQVMTANEVRGIFGLKPSNESQADSLTNPNINPTPTAQDPSMMDDPNADPNEDSGGYADPMSVPLSNLSG